MDSTELLEQLEENEPVIGKKVFGNDDGSVQSARWRAQRAQKRDALVEPSHLLEGILAIAGIGGHKDEDLTILS